MQDSVVLAKVDDFLTGAKKQFLANDLWSCLLCYRNDGTGAAKHDLERFGCGAFMATPRRADLMIVAGTVTLKDGFSYSNLIRANG